VPPNYYAIRRFCWLDGNAFENCSPTYGYEATREANHCQGIPFGKRVALNMRLMNRPSVA